MGRRLAVSDIHGEGHRLLKVLDLAKYAPGADRLFLLGDYIDRGTDSKRTVEIVQELVKAGAVALQGNHDLLPWKLLFDEIRVDDEDPVQWWVQKLGGRATLDAFQGWPPVALYHFMAGLPLYHEEPDCILVHAGLKPGTPLAEQNPNDLLWIRRTFINGYRGKRVIFGHSPTSWITGDPTNLEVWHGPDKTGIDTGAAYGGRLTLLDLDTHQTWWA